MNCIIHLVRKQSSQHRYLLQSAHTHNLHVHRPWLHTRAYAVVKRARDLVLTVLCSSASSGSKALGALAFLLKWDPDILCLLHMSTVLFKSMPMS